MFIGNNAGKVVTYSSNNVAVVHDALLAATGGNNVSIGTESLNGLTGGTNNVAIGNYAGSTNLVTGAGNVFIGDNVYPSADVSNKLYIDNSYSASDQPLIHGDFSTDELVNNGRLQARQIRRNIRSDATGGTHTVQESDCWIIVDNPGQTFIGLPDPATNVGRELMFKTRQAGGNLVSGEDSGIGWQTVNDAEQPDGVVSSAILPGTAGAWATLVAIDDGDGTRGSPRWVIMQRSP